jgi:CheY-like chemotaxis protein
MFLHKRVAVIDDDKKVVMLLEKLLSKMGCKTYPAYRGKTGLELVKKEKPDLLICDMFIPDIQGPELIEKVRNTPGFDRMKIILITGVYKTLSIDPKVKKMCDGIIEKPLDVKVIAEKILKLLS